MDPLIDGLNRVYKYGRLRQQHEWLPLKRQMTADWARRRKDRLTAKEATAQSRSVFADFLADEGDPREAILRGESIPFALEQFSYPSANTQLSDGSSLTATVHPTGQVQLSWSGGLHQTDVMSIADSGHTPDEARDILSRFTDEDAPTVGNLRSLIDTHFPKKATDGPPH